MNGKSIDARSLKLAKFAVSIIAGLFRQTFLLFEVDPID